METIDHGVLIQVANGQRVLDPLDVKRLAAEAIEWRRVYRNHDPAKIGAIDAVTVTASAAVVEAADRPRDAVTMSADDMPSPIPLLLWCPGCGERHIDGGTFASKPHHTHACQNCGMVWRPSIRPTVGVLFLPGFKDVDPVDTSPPVREGTRRGHGGE